MLYVIYDKYDKWSIYINIYIIYIHIYIYIYISDGFWARYSNLRQRLVRK